MATANTTTTTTTGGCKAPRAKPIVGPIGGTPEQQAFLDSVASEFEIDKDRLIQIRDHYLTEMQKGLDHEDQTLAMIPSYVEGRLTGQEKGNYLALDLGGTNLRVVLVCLEGNGKFKTTSTKSRLTEELKTGSMRNLCDYIADCIDAFLTEQNLTDQNLDLGYTFSFPVLQTSINRGILKHWTKGFSCTGAAGKDPVMQLQDALLRKQIPVRVAAIVNDTVGTLLSNAYSRPQTLAGLILGTGANGAYIERMSNIGKWKGGETTHPEMIINMELGSFDNERQVLPVTRFDNKVDRESINPHSQIYEKMVSGMYLGEIARNVLLELMDRELLFGPKDSEFNPNANCQHISGHYAFETEYMSRIEADDGDLRATRELLDLNLDLKVTEVEARIFKRVCEMVGRRASRLAACAIAAIVQHCEVDPKVGADIGIDGSLYEFYPCFEERIYEALEVLLPDFSNVRDVVRLGLAKDGSGVGAALTACVAARMADARQQQKKQTS